MLVAGIKSRPVYKGLTIQPRARRHIFALEGEGAKALLDQQPALDETALSRSEILYVARGSQGSGLDETLRRLGADMFFTAPTIATLLFRLKGSLATAHMGTRLYISGTEGFIGQAMLVALDYGMDHPSIITEHRGSLARRVQCVHCKGITDDVTTSPFACSHCGLTLLVRDHYSRRLAAFQGVNIDAEEPGSAPQPKELFL
ncbi:dimethylamine monooxygenase subunit DmmA family protein [Rhizobium sp. MC63]|uniref:Dimethylamine monooxygenase subunit DmmA family protein n=1 Tax=Rhizobium mulingense TaxID=3031128 RepID=A0ACC6N2V2_9HYPH|nr:MULTISPECIES: dimethylamine monooxygenase subunit DmmA family protein [unclassified Rhizobium]MDF0699592.1 dimethylamine monooxygenase subunit DmmA family protein [Rhizobium sp. MC63]MEA3519912.1 dimethylamine monooxygenase subunit DmmA family protein [Rhizobium sp. MJ31]MEB3044718.1 dimethylamine monooxygenase subunit DmmA family protein [Rhizobium sp. MJ21]